MRIWMFCFEAFSETISRKFAFYLKCADRVPWYQMCILHAFMSIRAVFYAANFHKLLAKFDTEIS